MHPGSIGKAVKSDSSLRFGLIMVLVMVLVLVLVLWMVWVLVLILTLVLTKSKIPSEMEVAPRYNC